MQGGESAGLWHRRLPPARRMTRVPLLAPFTKPQAEVVQLIGQGLTAPQIAARLCIPYSAVVDRMTWAAKKIPGDLPPWVRILVWSRGATLEVLGAA